MNNNNDDELQNSFIYLDNQAENLSIEDMTSQESFDRNNEYTFQAEDQSPLMNDINYL